MKTEVIGSLELNGQKIAIVAEERSAFADQDSYTRVIANHVRNLVYKVMKHETTGSSS